MNKKIIFDTDIGTDCDDAVALSYLLSAERRGLCSLIGVTYSWYVKNAIPLIGSFLDYYKRTDIPVGSIYIKDNMPESDCYASATIASFPNKLTYENVPRASELIRRLLTESDEKVVIAATGPLGNIADFLLNVSGGVELFREKVSELCIMGGDFSAYDLKGNYSKDEKLQAEYNIKCDIAASKAVCDLSPVRTVFCPFETGFNVISGKKALKIDSKGNNPLTRSLLAHGSPNGRHSWDPLTAVYAIEENDLFNISVSGKVTVDNEGCTLFTPGEGQHFFLKNTLPRQAGGDFIDERIYTY